MIDASKLYDAPSSVASRPSDAPAQSALQTQAQIAATFYDATPATSAAGQLYATPAEPPRVAQDTPSAPQAASTQEEREQARYSEGEEPPVVEVPESIKAMREADGLRTLYSPQGSYASVLPDDMMAADEAVKDIPEPVQRAAISELREMAADLSMSHDDVRALQSIARQIPSKPTEAERITWREQAVTRLNETYGNGAAQAVRDARAFIAQDPRRAKLLDAKGLGDHPDTVLMVARLARQARIQGKLK